MHWHRPSGSVAALQCTTPTKREAYGHGARTKTVLDMLHAVAVVSPSPGEHDEPASAVPRMFSCPSACGSPRALGDVPLLLSEQYLYSTSGSATAAEAGRRVCGGSACSDALHSAASCAEAGPRQSEPPRRADTFGADSKFGFEAGAPFFFMDSDSDEFD